MQNYLKKTYYPILILGIILIGLAIGCNYKYMKHTKLHEVSPGQMEENTDEIRIFYFDGSKFTNDREYLAFYTIHKFVSVYADDELIYEKMQDGGIWGHSTGSVWNFVHIPKDTVDIKVMMKSAYHNDKNKAVIFYSGRELDMFRTIYLRSLPLMFTSLITVLLGIIMILYWLLVRKKAQIEYSLLYLGIFAVLIGLWSANETDCSALIYQNRVAACYIAFILLMLIEIPLAMFVKEFLGIGDSRGWRILCGLSVIQFIVSVVLQALDLYDLKETVFVTHIILILSVCYVVMCIIRKIINHEVNKRVKISIVGISFILFATVMDLVLYYKRNISNDITGRFIFLAFIFLFGKEAVSYALDMMEKGRRASEIVEHAMTDALTELLGRNAYEQTLSHIENPDDMLVVVFDLNNLKKYNDTFGHKEGDAYLVKAAEIISMVFGSYGTCFRIGGDEFCCLIEQGSLCPIKDLISKLRDEEEQYNKTGKGLVLVEISCGYAIYDPKRDLDLEETRERADQMMYEMKYQIKKTAK